MKPRDFSNVPGGPPFALMALTVILAVIATLMAWSACHRKEYLQVEKEIIIITITHADSVLTPHPRYLP
jgi:hypothetical protein